MGIADFGFLAWAIRGEFPTIAGRILQRSKVVTAGKIRVTLYKEDGRSGRRQEHRQ